MMPDAERFMVLNPELSDYIRDTLYASKQRHFHGAAKARELLQHIVDANEQSGPFQKERVRAATIEFFCYLTQLLRLPSGERQISVEIEKVQKMLQKDPSKNWGIQEMAESINLSQSYFKQKFKQETGFSPYDWILRYRVSLAKQMLDDPDNSATRIAYMLGFSSSQHFANIFKQFEGKTPGQYRKTVLAERTDRTE